MGGGKAFLEVRRNWTEQSNLTKFVMMKSRPTVYLIK